MTQITTHYDEGGSKPKRIGDLGNKTFFRLEDTQTIWRMQGSIDYQTFRVLNLDDLEVETMPHSQMVIPVEVNSIDIKVELV